MHKETTAEDVSRPLCKCHGEPMMRNSKQRSGIQKWACARKRREYGQRTYYERGGKEKRQAVREERRLLGVCQRCGGPLTTEVLCWDCLSRMEERRLLYFSTEDVS